METYFWRPIDKLVSPNSGTGVDIIYIGRKDKFPYSVGEFKGKERLTLPLSKFNGVVDGEDIEQLSDHDCEGFKLEVTEFEHLSYIEWYEKKDFRGTRHIRPLHPRDSGKCLRLRNNDAMKSIKFYGKPGWKLRIYDSPGCGGNDDWGELTFPNDENVKSVSVPKIGRRGPDESRPEGSYRFHHHNGLPGKVSAIKLIIPGI
jgi:hypothetical protein